GDARRRLLRRRRGANDACRRVLRPAAHLGPQRDEESMTPEADRRSVSEAVVTTRRGPSIVWLIPLVAALVGGFVAWRTWSELGPKIEIQFDSAEGLEAGKTEIKYKDVAVGVVEEIRLQPDLS